jgi:phage-related protein
MQKDNTRAMNQLGSAADLLRFDFDTDATSGPEKFANEVRRLAEEMNDVQRKVIHSLTPMQLSILKVMAAAKNEYAPFEAGTMEKYRQAMHLAGLQTEDTKVDVPNVQQALIALQDKKLVWRASRGVYAIEEQSIVDILSSDGLLNGLH